MAPQFASKGPLHTLGRKLGDVAYRIPVLKRFFTMTSVAKQYTAGRLNVEMTWKKGLINFNVGTKENHDAIITACVTAKIVIEHLRNTS